MQNELVIRPLQLDTPGKTDTIELLDFLLQAAHTFQQAKSDGGGINWKDAPKLFSLIGPADAAFEGDENIVPFLKNADPVELQAILDHVDSGFPFRVDRELLDKAEVAAVAVYDLIRAVARRNQNNAGSGEVEEV